MFNKNLPFIMLPFKGIFCNGTIDPNAAGKKSYLSLISQNPADYSTHKTKVFNTH
jgi:hypothetical protein